MGLAGDGPRRAAERDRGLFNAEVVPEPQRDDRSLARRELLNRDQEVMMGIV